MRTLYFDRLTLKGQSFKSNTSVELEVSNDISLSKSIEEYDKDIQKTDDNGNLLYLKNNYENIVHENIIGYDETTVVTDIPLTKSVWKTNEEGFKLYKQVIYNEEGFPTSEFIEVTNHINVLTWREETYYEPTDNIIGHDEYGNNIYEQVPHTHQVPDRYEYNTPIYVDEQDTDVDGNKLYLKPIVESWEEKVISSTTETTEQIQVFTYKDEEITKTIQEKVSDCNHICDELCGDGCIHECGETCEPVYETKTITEIIQVPDEYEENQPCMIPTYKSVQVDIFSRPEEFSITKLLEVIYAEKMQKYDYSNIITDMFINEDDIDFTYDEHSANTGAFILTLLPQGKVKLKPIELEEPARKFELLESEIPSDIDIYINNVKFVDGIALLTHPASVCTLRFENKSNKSLDIKSYAIMY